jgi:hypothetical protein
VLTKPDVNSPCQMSRITTVPYVFYADTLADTSKLNRVFATVRCELATSETRINNLKECYVNWNYPITGFHGEGSWCSCVISGLRCLEMTWNWLRLPVPIICTKVLGRNHWCMKRPIFLGNVEIQNAVSTSVCPSVIEGILVNAIFILTRPSTDRRCLRNII